MRVALSDALFWRHFCTPQRGWLMVGKGEPCNWCDAKECA